MLPIIHEDFSKNRTTIFKVFKEKNLQSSRTLLKFSEMFLYFIKFAVGKSQIFIPTTGKVLNFDFDKLD